MSGLDALLAGHTLVKRYRIGEVIGRGGFAVVYEAYDERLHRNVAVKVIRLSGPEGALAAETRARFQREAHASAALQHPNVVGIYDFGTDPALGLDFLVMERLVGQDLRARLASPEPISTAEAMHILTGAAAGIAAGHQAGIIHRDVKPGNVFLATGGGASLPRVCVLDFGIALLAAADDTTRLTQGGIPLSVPYASPEQIGGSTQLTPASDVFGLGAVAYETLSRRRPFSGDPLRAVEERSSAPAPLRELNPEVPAQVANAVQRALAPDPAHRFRDAGEFARALEAPPESSSVAAPIPVAIPAPPRTPGPAAAPLARRRSGGLLVVLAVVGLVLLGGALMLSRMRSGGEEPQAERVAPPATEVGRVDSSVAESTARPAPAAGGAALPDAGTAVVPEAGVDGSAPAGSPAPVAKAPPRTPASEPAPAPREPAPNRAASGAEFRENLSHPCQSLPQGEAVACLNRDLEDADRELNVAFRQAMSRLDGDRRQSLLDGQRAWLARYDRVITSYYSTSWGNHSRIQVLPSQIQALRDRTEYLRAQAGGGA